MKPFFKSPVTWLTLAMILYGILIAEKVSTYVGGSDSSGYYNSAQLLSHGKVRTELRTIPGLPVGTSEITPFVYLPLGFHPERKNEMVPGYPIGVPLLMTVTSWFVEWFNVPGWVAGWNMFLGVLLTYGLARECGLRPAWSWFTLWILALSPLYTAMGLQPMSDVPALTWCTAALYFAFKTRRQAKWGLLCGFALSIAVLIRPTNVLLFLPVLICLGFDWRRWTWVIVGGLPGAGFLSVYNYAAYGKIVTTGYGDMTDAFGREWVLPTLKHYAIWLPRLFTPVVVLAFGLLGSRAEKRTIAVLTTWILAIFAFYSFYTFTHEVWWYLRFILPAAPALLIAAVLVLQRVTERFNLQLFQAGAPLSHHVVAGFILLIATVPNVLEMRSLHSLVGKKGDSSYWLLADWLNRNAPPNSVVAAMQNSGSLLAYSSFTVVRWDALNKENFSTICAQLAANRQPLYAVLFPFEEASAFANMPGDWKPIIKIFPGAIWKYNAEPKAVP